MFLKTKVWHIFILETENSRFISQALWIVLLIAIFLVPA